MSTESPWYIRARLKTRQLMLLVTLAEEGNLHRAAQLLNMTQPAASKLLKDLEDALEVPLFDRLPRGMQPTWYGETMIRHARAALGSLGEAHEELVALKAGRFGQVGVGAISSTGLTLLPPAVAMVKREQPTLRVAIDIDTSDVLMERLAQGRLDILVARLFAQHDTSRLRFERLAAESVCVIARAGHPLAGAVGQTLSGVAACGWSVRHRFELVFRESGLAAPIDIVETSALLFITRMLEQSDMLAVIGGDVARYYAAHGIVAVLELGLRCPMDDFGIVTRTDRPLSPAAHVMLRALRACSDAIYRPPAAAAT